MSKLDKGKNQIRRGWEVPLAELIPNHLKCSLCSLLMRNPIQTIRGELACEFCYHDALMNSLGICPIDNEPISNEEYFKDKFKSNEVGKIKCFCSFKENGCPWKGTIAQVEIHQTSCLYQPSTCPLCYSIMNPDQSMNDHLKECEEFMMSEEKICMYSIYGCTKKINSIEEHIDHLRKDSLVHSVMQKKHFEVMLSESVKLKKNFDFLKKTSKEELDRMKETVEFLSGKVLSLTNTIQETQNQLQNIKEISDSQQKTFNKMEPNSDEQNEVEKLSTTVTAMHKKISELDLKQQLYENSSYNGKMVWKIDNLNFRMQQAVIGRVTVLHSAPCFTKKNGYRFCGRLYLNGDGMGKCTHVSVFFVLMKSEYDNILQWPFTKRVKFRLVNQDDPSKSIEESFIPDRLSSSFQQPVRDMNVAAGCPMFVSKDDLFSNGFVKDDAIFIEIAVS